MAIVDVAISSYNEEGVVTFSRSPAKVSVGRGDTLRFTYTNTGGTAANVFVSNFQSGVYTVTTPLNITAASPVGSRVIRSDATIGAGFFLTISASGFSPLSIEVEVVSGVDTTPDNVTFITISGNPNEVLQSNTVRITGINTSVSVSCVGGQFFKVSTGETATSGSVSNGDYIALVKTAPSQYNSSATMTVNIGSISRTWTVETFADPGSGQVIPFPVQTGTAITLEQVLDFFGGDDVYLNPGRPNNMRSYFKGGAYVPNITKNANVPTSGTLRLSNFIGSGTALYFLKSPGYQFGRYNTLNGAGTVFTYWSFTENRRGDPAIGFGPITFSCQYRYRVRMLEGPTVTTNRGPVGSWSAWDSLATLVSVSYATGQNTEVTCVGEVDFEVRSTYAPTVVLTATAPFNLYAYGP